MFHVAMIGIDGSGKTTIINMLKEYFESFDMNIAYCSIKGNNYNLINQAMKNKMLNRDSIAIACALDLYKQYHELKNNVLDVVFWDRFYYCIEACNSDYTLKCIKDILKNIPKPVCTFYFDVEPDIALKRIKCRGNLKPHETLEYLTECRKKYLSLQDVRDFFFIDASKSKMDVFNDIVKVLKECDILC